MVIAEIVRPGRSRSRSQPVLPVWRRLWQCALLVAGVLAFAPSPAAAEVEARQVIQTFSDRLLQVMKQAHQLGFQGRLEMMRPAVAEAYDLPAMTRAAIGPAAARLTPDELKHLGEAFNRFTVASYAQEFDSWDGERFEVGQPHPSTEGQVIVPSKIVPKSGEPTEIDYVMHKDDGNQWRIIDVLLEGSVSQVAVRRSEFVSIYRRNGVAGLIDVLDRKTAAMGKT